MHALITGAGGTVGRALVDYLTGAGATVTPWDRAATPVNDPDAMARLLDEVRPTVLFHLAIASRPSGLENEGLLVDVLWPEHLARLTAARAIPLVFTSSVMVFSDDAHGPFTVDSLPDAAPGSYGDQKREAEQRVRAAGSLARVVRLGWQIGDAPGSNNMIDFLEARHAAGEPIGASRHWYPACSFLPDTAAALVRAATLPPDLYLCDANRRWTFFEIVTALNGRHGGRWRVEADDSFVYDQRMIDERLQVPPLDARLSSLP